MKTLWLILISVGSLLADGDGAGPMLAKPPIAEVLPLTDTEAGVEVSNAMLLNLNTIIPVHAIMRVCYVPPQSNDAAVSQIRQEQNKNSSYTRQTEDTATAKPLPPEILAALRIAKKTVWPTAINFRRAFEVMNASDMRVVYMDPKTRELNDDIINLPEGLFLVEKGNQVVVASVEVARSGATAGFIAGDRLRQIGGVKLDGTLSNFVQVYREAQASAEQASRRKLDFLVERAGASDPVTLIISRPPSLKGSLLDGN